MYTIVYTNNIEFEWDEQKNKANIEKHDIDFQDAVLLFESPIIARIDDRQDYGEKRWIALGRIKETICVVVYTLRKSKIRIISLRKANKSEREIYHEKIQQNKLEKNT